MRLTNDVLSSDPVIFLAGRPASFFAGPAGSKIENVHLILNTNRDGADARDNAVVDGVHM